MRHPNQFCNLSSRRMSLSPQLTDFSLDLTFLEDTHYFKIESNTINSRCNKWINVLSKSLTSLKCLTRSEHTQIFLVAVASSMFMENGGLCSLAMSSPLNILICSCDKVVIKGHFVVCTFKYLKAELNQLKFNSLYSKRIFI